jgi:Cof subfamily protein (haloacid dehalogenase superfamily)
MASARVSAAGQSAHRERISLLVSDVDGTLVTDDKRLTDAAVAAAAHLADAGVHLALVSSRPPMGFAELADRLDLKTPIGAFNGGVIVDPDGRVIERRLVTPADAVTALAAFAAFGLDGWLFSTDRWYVTNASGALVPKEKMTIRADPTVVPSFEPLLGSVGKLVGTSTDHDRVAACEAALARQLGPETAARRSQPYYLDVSPAAADKGYALRRIADLLAVPTGEVAAIGDMANDLPMFAIAPYRIAMGNAIDTLKQQATFVTASNERDGWARAVKEFVLPCAPAMVTL